MRRGNFPGPLTAFVVVRGLTLSQGTLIMHDTDGNKTSSKDFSVVKRPFMVNVLTTKSQHEYHVSRFD
jgi:hypothetical protein